MEENKLLAEFLGETVMKDLSTFKLNQKKFLGFIYYVSAPPEKHFELRFKQDWNWLMKVVERIESLGYKINIFKNYIFIGINDHYVFAESVESRIKGLYKACVTFVKFYNKELK